MELRQSLQKQLALARDERDFVCRASQLVPSPRPGSGPRCVLDNIPPGLPEWTRKRYLALAFADPALQSPISTFGHTSLVATDRNDGTLELDAILLEFTAEGELDLPMASRALTTGAEGRFQLRWFLDKQTEYDLKDRDLWIFPIRSAVRTPGDLGEVLKSVLPFPQKYRFASQNCADRIFELLTEGRISSEGTRPLAIPLDELREITSAGWTLPPVRIQSLSSQCTDSMNRDSADTMLNRIQEIRLLIRKSMHSYIPQEVESLRNICFITAQQDLLLKDPTAALQATATAPATCPVDLQRGPDFRMAASTGTEGAGWSLSARAGSFDFITADPGHCAGSALEVLSAQASSAGGRVALDRLTLVHLDTQESRTPASEGQVRWLDLSWTRYSRLPVLTGAPPREAMLSYGAGGSWSLDDGARVRCGLLPVAGLGTSWNARGTGQGSAFSAYLGVRGQLQLDSGRLPRCRVYGEWRCLETMTPFRSRYGAVVVPWAGPWGALSLGYQATGNRSKEWTAGIALPLR